MAEALVKEGTEIPREEEGVVVVPLKDASSCLCPLPQWRAPNPEQMTFPPPGLRLYNSLTRQKELFVTMNGGKHLTWYM
jgi:hypothetical protein